MQQWHSAYFQLIVISTFFLINKLTSIFTKAYFFIAEVRKFLRQNPTCIDKMISMLNPDLDPLTNEYAAMWLKNMCEDYSTKTVVAMSQGAVTNLINMLASNDADAIFNSLGAIDKLMDDYQTRHLVREYKGIEPILNLMKSEFPQIQELVFSSLSKLTHNAENREAFRELGGLEKLVDFLSNPDQKDMHINCLNVLSNCLEDTQCLDVGYFFSVYLKLIY